MRLNENQEYSNKLIKESSPYLLQHAHNPVMWYPWTNQVMEKALTENKLLLISIGYSACHWCHVMERESFMDLEVASIMNEHFVCIKVDREERPDIDHVYMEAIQLMNGNGGWPLNCFALPDGRPFWGGTYFPKIQWIELLEQIILLNEKTPYKLKEQADMIKKGILDNQNSFVSSYPQKANEIDTDKIYNTISYQLDNEKGGTVNAPKFPMPVIYQYLLNYYQLSKTPEVLNHIHLTLSQMAYGGIFDQLGGGFARYSTDVNWFVPHFEKMLYDNAQLISLYSNAFRLTKNKFYKDIAESTFLFLEHELQDESGLFYAALDADSEGEEGRYYVWKKSEIEKLLGNDADLFCNFFNVSEYGNWEENKNILFLKKSIKEYADEVKISETDMDEAILKSKTLLTEYREKRVKPQLDNKILVSWNALMISALIEKYFAFGENEDYLSAVSNANFIIENYFTNDGKLIRTKGIGDKFIYALLDDYAFLTDSLILLYQADGNTVWIDKSIELIEICIEHFYDKNTGLFFYKADFESKLYFRNKEIVDNVISSSNSSLFTSIFKIGMITSDNKLIGLAKRAINAIIGQIKTYPAAYANWLILLRNIETGFFTVSITGDKAGDYAAILHSFYFPNTLVLQSSKSGKFPLLQDKYKEGKTLIYICSEKECLKVIENIDEAIDFLK